jgi:hypothetical protein
MASGERFRAALAAGALALAAAASQAPAHAAPITAADAATRLAAMHPDQGTYIARVRTVEAGAHGAVYAGLVRPGGTDPADEDDAPARGNGARNDLVIFPETLDRPHSSAWLDVILDHEYFHARHLARGFTIPLVSFGSERIDRNYLEALAWGWVVGRIDDGLHAGLTPKERAEVQAAYERHLEAFRQFILARHPEAWAHYGRFFPAREPQLKLLAAAP